MAGEFPGLENHGGEPGFVALIAGVKNRGDGAAPDPVARAFIGDGEPPASGARDAAGSVASVDDGAGAGDRDHAGPGAKSGFQGNYVVADNLDVGETDLGCEFGENAANLRGDLGDGSAGDSDTDGANLTGRNLGGGADMADCGVQRFPCLRLAEANDVAAAGHCLCEHSCFVGEKAAGFGAAAVDSEIVGHRASSNTGSP